MNFHIRQATSTDAETITRLVQQLAAEIHESSPIHAQYVADYLQSAVSRVILAEDDGQVVGMLSCTLRPNLYHAGQTCLVEELIVERLYRSQGVGRQLMLTLFNELRADGCVEVSVSTGMENTGAIRFYRSLGMDYEALLLEKHL